MPLGHAARGGTGMEPPGLEARTPEPDVRLLGPPRIAGRAGEHGLERKAAGLLAYLALHGESARNTLAALLWPDAEPESARNNLRQALFKLRRAAPRELIAGTLTLRLAPGITVDATGRPTPDGLLLEGCDYLDCPDFARWLDGERNRLDRLRHDRVAAECAALEEAGRFDEALRLAEDNVRRLPLEEAGHRRLIRLHYLRGDRAAALAAYGRCVESLRAELDVEPTEETRALAASLESGDAPAAGRPARAAVPVTMSRPPRLVGREPEIAALHGAWQEERAFAVLGEPGLGKSRLLAEFAAQAPGILVVAARPGDAGIPYASLARLLRLAIGRSPALAEGAWRGELARLLPELDCATGRPKGGQRLVLQRALVAFMQAAIATGVAAVIVDDLHFADEASTEMFHSLAAAEGLERLRWGYAQRPAEGGPAAQALREALGEASALVEVRLAPLDVARMAELVDSLAIPGLQGARVAGQLVRFTGGNPLFALETLKNALAGGAAPDRLGEGRLPRPESVGALIARRLKQLSPGALAVARVAALAGTDFGAELAARVLQSNELALADAWNELEAAQVLRDAAFAHDLVYEAMRQSVPRPIARQTHRRIAEFLEERGGEPARLAEHWIAAGETGRAVPHLKAAAVLAEAAARFGEARALLERAIAATEEAGLKSATLELQFLLVELLKDIGAAGETLAVIARMQANVATADERLRFARSQAAALTYLGKYGQAEVVARQALDDEDCIGDADPQRVAELRHQLAQNLLVNRRVPEALALLALVETPIRDHPDPQYRGWFHSDYGRALLLSDRLEQADQQLDAGLVFARQVGRQRMICGLVAIKGQVAAAAGLIHEPVERFQEAQRAIVDLEPSVITMVLQYLLATSLVDAGRYREALAAIEFVLATPAQADVSWQGRALGLRALILGHLGQRRLAELGQADADRVPLLPMSIAASTIAKAELNWMLGTPMGMDVEGRRPEIAGLGTPSLQWRLDLTLALANPGSIAAKAMETLLRSATDRGLLGHALGARLALALAAKAQGDAGACVEHAREVLKAMRRHTLPGGYRPRPWLICHQLLHDIEPELASRALREGKEWIQAVARFHVPEEFRDGFLHRNPVNRALLAATAG